MNEIRVVHGYERLMIKSTQIIEKITQWETVTPLLFVVVQLERRERECRKSVCCGSGVGAEVVAFL